jgi:hypothetical protein
MGKREEDGEGNGTEIEGSAWGRLGGEESEN